MRYTTPLLREIRQAIGHVLRDQRTRRRMTLHKLSRLTGIPAARLDQYELGKNDIGLDEMVKVWCALCAIERH